MALNLDGIADFVNLTLDNFRRNQFADISLDLQEYMFASRYFDMKKRAERGGVRLNWKLRVANQETAKDSGLYAVDDTNRRDVTDQATQEWSKQTVNYTYDIDEEAFQSGPERIIDEMILNEQGLYNDFFAHMETRMWTAPNSVSQDPRPPAGIPFWIQKADDVNGAPGFNGGDPSGFPSGAGGLSVSDYPNWANWAGNYAQVSQDDLIDRIVDACDFTYFMAPKEYPEIGGGMPDYGFYTVQGVLSELRRLLQKGNENLGPDVAAWKGEIILKGNVVKWVPALTNSSSAAYDSSDPFYAINWKKFNYFYKAGRNMIKYPPKQAARQHTVYERHMDNWGNFVCFDRRQGGFVFSKKAS